MVGLAHAALCKHAEVVELCSDIALSLFVETFIKLPEDTVGAEEALAFVVEFEAVW